MLDDSDKLNIYNKDLSGDAGGFVDESIPVQPPKPPRKNSMGPIILLLGFVAIVSVVYLGYTNFIAPNLPFGKSQNSVAEQSSSDGDVTNEADSFYNEVTKDGDVKDNSQAEAKSQSDSEETLIDIPNDGNAKSAKDDLNNAIKDVKNDVSIPVGRNLSRENPFLPYMESPVPGAGLGFELLPPPDEITDQAKAVEMMKTTVSGIMYDRYRPSAIINVNGTDQLVHKGDRLADFVVLNITPDKVIVKTGTNIYRASVGQTIGDDTFNFNAHNVRRQFGGAYTARPRRVLEITSY